MPVAGKPVNPFPRVLLLAVLALLHAASGEVFACALQGVAIRVVDSDRNPVPAAQVLVWTFPMGGGSMTLKRPATPPTETYVASSSGQVVLAPSVGEHLVTAQAAGMTALFDIHIEANATPRHEIEIELVPEVTWNAQVLEADTGQHPTGRMTVSVRRDGNADTFTLDTGVLRLDRKFPDVTFSADRPISMDLPATPSFIWVYAEGCAGWTEQIDPRQPTSVRVHALRHLVGRVVDLEDAPIKGCSIIGDWNYGLTDAEGAFDVAVPVDDGAATLHFAAPGFALATRMLDLPAAGTSDLTVQLEPQPPLRGEIRDARGRPVTAYVDLLRVRLDGGPWEALDPSWSATSMSGADGAFSAPVPQAGEYLVSIDDANGPGGRQLTLRTSDAPVRVQLADDEHGAMDHLDVVALEQRTRAAIGATWVQLTTCYGQTWSCGSGAYSQVRIDGAAGFMDVPLGTVDLRVAARNHLVHDSTFEDTVGGDRVEEVLLSPARCVWLRLVDEQGRPLPAATASVIDAHEETVPLLVSPRSVADELVTDRHGEACVDGLPLGAVTLVLEAGTPPDAPGRGTLRGVLPARDATSADGITEIVMRPAPNPPEQR